MTTDISRVPPCFLLLLPVRTQVLLGELGTVPLRMGRGDIDRFGAVAPAGMCTAAAELRGLYTAWHGMQPH
jgi:hypothetical protein